MTIIHLNFRFLMNLRSPPLLFACYLSSLLLFSYFYHVALFCLFGYMFINHMVTREGITFGNFVSLYPFHLHLVSVPYWCLRFHCNVDIPSHWQGSYAVLSCISSNLSYVA